VGDAERALSSEAVESLLPLVKERLGDLNEEVVLLSIKVLRRHVKCIDSEFRAINVALGCDRSALIVKVIEFAMGTDDVPLLAFAARYVLICCSRPVWHSSHPLPYEVIAKTFPMLLKLLESNHIKGVESALGLIDKVITSGGETYRVLDFDRRLLQLVVQLLPEKNPFTIRIIEHLARGYSVQHTKALIEAGVLPLLKQMMFSTEETDPTFIFEILRGLMQTEAHIQAVFDCNIIDEVFNVLNNNQKEEQLYGLCLDILSDAVVTGSLDQVKSIAEQGALDIWCSVLNDTQMNSGEAYFLLLVGLHPFILTTLAAMYMACINGSPQGLEDMLARGKSTKPNPFAIKTIWVRSEI